MHSTRDLRSVEAYAEREPKGLTDQGVTRLVATATKAEKAQRKQMRKCHLLSPVSIGSTVRVRQQRRQY